MPGRFFFLPFVATQAIIANNSHQQTQWSHADSSRRSILDLSRETVAPRDLELSVSQMLRWFSFISMLVIFICKTLKRHVAFCTVCFDIKPHIAICNFFCLVQLHSTIKLATAKEFGNSKSKVVLPLVPKSTNVAKKEDLLQLKLFGNPTRAHSMKVCFAFEMLEGAACSPPEVIQWCKNLERTFPVSIRPQGHPNTRWCSSSVMEQH